MAPPNISRKRDEPLLHEGAVRAFHPGGNPFPAMPPETLHDRIARLEKAIIDNALNARFLSDAAIQLIAARAQVTG